LTFSFVRASYEAVYRKFCRTLKVADDDIAAKEHTFQQLLGLIRGRVYYNLLNWYLVLALLPGFTVIRRFLEQSPGVKESLRDKTADIDDSTIRAFVRSSWGSGRVLAALFWNYFALSPKIKRFYDRLDRTLIAPVPAIADMRIDELAAHYRNLRSQLLTGWDVPVLNDFYTMIFHGTLKRLSERWLGASELANAVMRAEGRMVSVEPAARLREMAALAAGNSELVEVLRYRISCESHSKTMALLLFGGPHSSRGNWFGLLCSWLLFHLCCRTLRTFATEAVGKFAAIIRVNLGVVLGS
jgi:hypothetical protein